jgi:polyferredoxin
LALALFVALIVAATRGAWRGEWVNIPMRLDPLLALTNLLASRTLVVGSLVALVLVALTLLFGRAWCGWLCPLSTILDIFPLDHWRGERRAPASSWRGVKYGLLMTILVAAIFGNLTLLIFDPLTIFARTLTTSVLPWLDQGVTWLESALYRLPFLAAPISTFDAWLRPAILPYEPLVYRSGWLFAGLFLGVITLNLFAPRFWCRYLCPLGGMLGLLSKVALFKRGVGESCKACTLCTIACPTGTVNPAKGYASDPGECTMCLDCLEACPREGITFTTRLSLAPWNHYDPNRRQALTSMGATLTGVVLFKSDFLGLSQHPHRLRPPGALEYELLSKCVRCGMCVRACPTGGLQPALTEAGLEGLWTPVLTPSLGYCDYSCNTCGGVCPVEAIPPLPLEEKRTQVIGRAAIDRQRCIAWADQQDCIVCEEMCPVPEKAVWLEPKWISNADGSHVRVQLPHVIDEDCIGCGICEHKCPVEGQAAIRVFVG